MTTIYVDADACPVREEVYRVATRLDVPVRVVSNRSRPIRPPGLPNVEMIVVAAGADAADDWSADRIGAGDLCATADIPLAACCLAPGAPAHWRSTGASGPRTILAEPWQAARSGSIYVRWAFRRADRPR